MFEWMLLGLPLLVALATAQGTPATDEGGGGTATAKPPAEPAPEPGAGLKPAPAPEPAKPEEKPAEDAAGRTVEIPEDELLAMEQDREELLCRRAENARLRERARGRREKPTAEAATQPLTAETIAEAMVRALSQARPSEPPTIPGLKYEADGEVTYQGRPMDPDVAEQLIESRRQGETLRETVQRLQEHQAEIDARFAAADEAAEQAAIEAIETRHIARMEDYGLALCDQAIAHLDQGTRKLGRKAYYADLGTTLNTLQERGIGPEDITPEVVAGISRVIIAAVLEDAGEAPSRAQAAANADAREKQPLSRGGSVAEPGRPDPSKMTPQEREAYAERIAKELADAVHGAGSRPGTVEEGYPTY